MGPAKSKHQANPPIKVLGQSLSQRPSPRSANNDETIAITHDWLYSQACRLLHNISMLYQRVKNDSKCKCQRIRKNFSLHRSLQVLSDDN